LNILIASSTFYPTNTLNVGGIEQVSYSLFEDLNQYVEVSCDLVTTADSNLTGSNIIHEATLSKYALAGTGKVTRKYDDRTMSTIQSRSYDLIVCNTTSVSRLEQLLSTGCKVLLVIHQHHSFRNDFDRFSKYQNLKESHKRLVICTVSSHCKRMIEKDFPGLIDVIAAPISEETIPKVECKEKSGFIFIGRLGKSKNLDLALKVFNGFPHHLTVIGSVPSNPSSDLDYYRENQEKILNSAPNISYLGIKNREQVYSHLASSRALLITNPCVSFDLVGIEALRVGTPVVYTKKRTSGPDEYITNGLNGYGIETYNKREEFVIETLRQTLEGCKYLSPDKVKESYRSLKLNKLINVVLDLSSR